MNKYITNQRFKGKAIDGNVNIPATSELIAAEGYLIWKDQLICRDTSETAHNYFSINDDNNGLYRGKLIKEITSKLNKRDKEWQKRWDKVWDDKICLKYKKKEFDDYFLWGHEFYIAPILDLEYIKQIVMN